MRSLLLLTCLACGCASYTQSKIELTAQIRKGVELTRQETVERQQFIERLSSVQVDRLDDAFDADVRQRPSLDAKWVIEHRRAYALARDALSDQKHALRDGQHTIESNLDLIDQALQQLQLMHQIEARLTFPEVMK
jgi:hypothetical protein